MKNIFITGATGNMGSACFFELYNRGDRFSITLLARPSRKNRKFLKPYYSDKRVRIVWGDLLNYHDVLSCVTGADYVLHVGGMVSPMADMYPEKTLKVNVGAAKNIIKAVKAQKNADEIGVVYVGSVAQVGTHLPPNHWGRCGDPINPAIMDGYALSKALAELEFAESGLKRWVSIRQTGMLYPKMLLKANDPIVTHLNFSGVLEWSTVEDSGRALANICEDKLPDSFWRSFYNLSSGPSFRLTNYEFISLMLKTVHCPPPEKIFELNWFATRNFHGEWFSDSDSLEEILHFREGVDCKDYFKRMQKRLPWFFSLAPLVPPFIIRAYIKHIASTHPLGTLYWLKNGNNERIEAHFGSRKEWEEIPSWSEFDRARPSDKSEIHTHGYNEDKSISELCIEDMRSAAAFNGCKCLSTSMIIGDIYTPLEWERADGTTFVRTPNAVVRGGHWN